MSNPEAQAKYHVRRKEIERKIEKIGQAIEKHRASAGDNLHWGHVGDLALVCYQLNEVLKFLPKE